MVVAAFLVVVCIRAVATLLGATTNAVRLVAAVAAVGMVTWGAIDLGVRITDPGTDPFEYRQPDLAWALPTIRARGRDRAASTVLVRPAGTSLHGLFDGVVNELDRAGANVLVDSAMGWIFGSQRVGTPNEADAIWYVTEQGSAAIALRALPGARVLFTTSPLPPARDAELDRLQTRLRDQLVRAGRPGLTKQLDENLIAVVTAGIPGVDPALARQVAVLNSETNAGGRCRCAIVAVPGGRAAGADGRPAQG